MTQNALANVFIYLSFFLSALFLLKLLYISSVDKDSRRCGNYVFSPTGFINGGNGVETGLPLCRTSFYLVARKEFAEMFGLFLPRKLFFHHVLYNEHMKKAT
uniref:Uncharacterized protein n=1 Tax=Micrurus spixii TaxID=129469 RepID=A0A2D4LCT5_9SAUR